MYKSKYTKTNLRNPKHNNPNPRDLDQRERKNSPHQRSLGLARLGSRTMVVCLGRTQWSEADLLSLSVYGFFFFFLWVLL